MNKSLALLVAGCFFMESLDATIVTTAVPAISRDLGVSTTAVGLIITSYMLALAVMIPVGGWLLTRLSPRSIFVGAIAAFTAASLLCGNAPNLTVLVIARVLQGIGGALMVPVGRHVALHKCDKSQIVRLMSYIIWPGLIAPAIAPLVGGLITEHASWQWIFWINIPLGIVAITAAIRLMPTTVDEAPRTMDWLGFALLGSGLASALWAAHLISDTAGSPALIIGWIIAAAILCTLAFRHMFRVEHPLVELEVLRDRIFGLSQMGLGIYFLVISATPFLLPLMLQEALHLSPVASGTIVMFIFIGNIGIKPATTRLLATLGFRPLMIISATGLTFSTAAFAAIGTGTALPVIAAIALLSGIFRSTGLTALATVGFSTIDGSQRRAANTIVSINQQLPVAIGVAIAALGIRAGSSATGSSATTATYGWAFVIIAAIGSIAIVAAALMPRTAGRELQPQK